jgi:hypothetical protein
MIEDESRVAKSDGQDHMTDDPPTLRRSKLPRLAADESPDSQPQRGYLASRGPVPAGQPCTTLAR